MSRHVTRMSLSDAGHFTNEDREAIVASYPEHERRARVEGLPILGQGRVFPIEEEGLAVAPFEPPDHWPRLGGLDFGWDHPTAAVKLAWDRDADAVYITHCHRLSRATPAVHAAVLRGWGAGLRWAWPHDGLQHDKQSGRSLAAAYRGHGLSLLAKPAAFADGGRGLEAGVLEMLERMQGGRLKVFKHLNDWFEELRLYHRRDGRIVAQHDDLLAASRYAVMCLREARCETPKRAAGERRALSDYDPYDI